MVVLVFGVLPAALALIVLIMSVRSVIRAFGVVQVLLAIPTLYLTITSLWVLKRVFFDKAWATFYPYFAIALALPLVLMQWYVARRRQSGSPGR